MSQYGRDPTQVGDKGYGVPGNYYLGGVTGDAGGNTDFYPRGNLTTLSFQPVSHKQNPSRDYDQLTHMGGPNGWIVGPFQKQQEDKQSQSGQNSGGGATTAFRAQQERLRSQMVRAGTLADTSGGTSGTSGNGSSQQNGQNKDKTQFSFDKDGKAIVQSKDDKHNLIVDSKGKVVSLTSSKTIFHDPGNGNVYLGGTDKSGGMARVYTEKGLSKNTYAEV
jgi:hypothetical protein